MKTITAIISTLTAGLVRSQRTIALSRVTRIAFERWVIHHAVWANAFFDEHFLLGGARPYLYAVATGEKVAEPLLLAGAWANQFPWPAARRQQRVAELLPAAREFLAIFQTVLCEEAVQRRWAGVGPFQSPASASFDFPCPEQL